MKRDSLVRLLVATRLYRTARYAHEHWLRREIARQQAELRTFYARFVRPGDLVFDIGANIGRRTEVFLSLGAKVVAVEPNEACAREIRAMFPGAGARLAVEQVALGSDPGEATLRICREHHDMSTLSEAFIDSSLKGWAGKAGCHWDQTVKVPVATMDQLIERHGQPSFVKIDVEGFELRVLEGLSRSVGCLSFEFRSRMTEMGLACIDRLSTQGSLEFNFVRGEATEMNCPSWLPAEQMKQLLTGPKQQQDSIFCDIYARAA